MNLRAINENLPLPILLVLVGNLAFLSHPMAPSQPVPLQCIGSRSQANAQRGAEVWVRQHPVSPTWTSSINRSARVQCYPISQGEQWAECHIGPVDTAGTNYVVDCDTAERNNIGCVSGR